MEHRFHPLMEQPARASGILSARAIEGGKKILRKEGSTVEDGGPNFGKRRQQQRERKGTNFFSREKGVWPPHFLLSSASSLTLSGEALRPPPRPPSSSPPLSPPPVCRSVVRSIDLT